MFVPTKSMDNLKIQIKLAKEIENMKSNEYVQNKLSEGVFYRVSYVVVKPTVNPTVCTESVTVFTNNIMQYIESLYNSNPIGIDKLSTSYKALTPIEAMTMTRDAGGAIINFPELNDEAIQCYYAYSKHDGGSIVITNDIEQYCRANKSIEETIAVTFDNAYDYLSKYKKTYIMYVLTEKQCCMCNKKSEFLVDDEVYCSTECFHKKLNKDEDYKHYVLDKYFDMNLRKL